MSFPVAFAAGIAAFFSPCVLPLLPGWLAFIGGNKARSKLSLLINLLLFVAGFTLVFTAMGALATMVGQYLRQYRLLMMRIGGGIIILFGLQMLGVFEWSFLAREKRLRLSLRHSPWGKFIFGIVLALGWTPCTGPILGSIVMLASSLETVYQGMLLLFVYSLGFALPFFVTGLVMDALPRVKSAKGARCVQAIAGIIVVFMGVLLLFNRWSWLQGLIL